MYWIGFIGYLATEYQLVPVVAKIEHVKFGWESISHGEISGSYRVVQIDYSYTIRAQNFLSSSVAFGCSETCELDTAARILKRDPHSIEVGQTILAWVSEKQPAISYLSKLSAGDFWSSVAKGLVLLASSPFLYLGLRSLTSGGEDA
jgi:hypothetical protein